MKEKELADLADHVFAAIGPGLSEVVYQNALAIAIRQEGRLVEREVITNVLYIDASATAHVVGYIRADLVVDKTTCLELKAKAGLSPADRVQTQTYLRHCEKYARAFLLNFGTEVTVEEIFPI